MTKLSIIIVSYNTKDITNDCLQSVFKSLNVPSEIIVVDNGSKDGAVRMLESLKVKKFIKLIKNEENLGYSKANNQGLKKAEGDYILFLNSDVIVKSVDFKKLLDYLDKYPQIGALTVKVNLTNGEVDPASHRGFPTLWRSFCYFFKLEKLFSGASFLNQIFGGYHLTYFDLKSIHEIDSGSGAFLLTRKDLMKKLNGFDEDFFMYGEDLDLAFRIKQLGCKIIYYPFYEITHLKYSSGLKIDSGEIRKRTKRYFYEAMKIFYQKHYQNSHPRIINKIVFLIIDLFVRL